MNLNSPNFRRKRLVWLYNTFYSRLLHASKRLTLSGHGEHALKSLKKYGYYESFIGLLTPDQPLEDLQNYAKFMLDQGKVNPTKPFWVDAWTRDSLVGMGNPFFGFGLSFLPIANAYLGCYSRYNAFRVNLTRVMPPGHPPVMSQIWHRDNEDYRILKIFLYLNDVDDDTGPFHYIAGSNYGNKWYDTFPLNKKKPFSPRISDVDLNPVIPGEDRMKFTGEAGSIILADTMGLHKGGYCLKEERMMFMGSFLSDGHFHKGWREYQLSDNLEVADTEAVRYAIGLG